MDTGRQHLIDADGFDLCWPAAGDGCRVQGCTGAAKAWQHVMRPAVLRQQRRNGRGGCCAWPHVKCQFAYRPRVCCQIKMVGWLQGSAGAGALRTATLQSAGGVDPRPQGANIGVLQGVRIATPFFGTGYNFCIGAAPFMVQE